MLCFVRQACSFDFKPYVRPIYNAILARLANQDQDQVGQMLVFFFFHLKGFCSYIGFFSGSEGVCYFLHGSCHFNFW